MKKYIYLFLISIVMILYNGCASASPETKSSADPSGMPAFVRNPPPQTEEIFGIGSIKLPAVHQAMTIGAYRARRSLANQLNANVQSMIADYAKSIGGISSNLVNDFTKQVEEQMTSRILTETIAIKWIKSADDTFWVLIIYNKIDAAALTAEVIEQLLPQYPDFHSMDAFTLMQRQLARITTKPALINY